MRGRGGRGAGADAGADADTAATCVRRASVGARLAARLPALLAAAVVAACAVAPRASGEWTSGRIGLSVSAVADRPAQSFAAAFELRGDGAQGELRLFSPLGTQLAAARWRPGLAELDTGDGARRFADPDALGREALGEAVPLAALPDWVAGRAWPGASSRALASGFEQLGWAIDLSQHGEGRIVARRAAPPAVTVRIALNPPA